MITFAVLMGLMALLAIGMPVGFALIVSGGVGLYLIGGESMLFGMLETVPVSEATIFELVTIPMFLLMAELVLVSGIADDLFMTATAWMGRIRGGLAMATALAGAGFAAICGTSTGSAATLAATTMPAMLKQGYEPRLAAGVVAISGTLAVLIPPSVAMVVFGLIADVSISKLLIGGIIPGLLVTLLIMGTVAFLVWRDPSLAPLSNPTSWRTKLLALRGVWPMLVLFGGVTGAIYTGITSPTEASAAGAIGALLIALARGRRSPALLGGAFLRATYSSCMLTMIIMGAHLFAYFVTLTQIPQGLIAWTGGLAVPPLLIMVLLLVFYIFLGMFMDQLAILVLTVPIVVPLIVSLGFDPVWFGVILVVTGEVGLVTPPVGLNCFVVARYADRPLVEVFQGVMPHVVAHLLIIALFVIFPGIILWLPSRM